MAVDGRDGRRRGKREDREDPGTIFNKPVLASEYPDYHQIVTTPMDLGTIQENIHRGRYASLEACAKDVRIVWTNAFLYNPPESVVAQSAHTLSKVFEGMYNEINPNDFNYAREPHPNERNKFSENIYRVGDTQLVEAVDLLEKRCPEAIVRNNDDGYFVVKVDALPAPVFWEVELYLRRRLGSKPGLTKKRIPTTYRPAPDSLARLSGRKRRSSSGSSGSASGGDNGESDVIGSNQRSFNETRAFAQTIANGNKSGHQVDATSSTKGVFDFGTVEKRTNRTGAASGNHRPKADTGDNLRRARARDGEPMSPSRTRQATDGQEEGGMVDDVGGGVESVYGAAIPDTSPEVDFMGWLEDPIDTSFREGGAGFGIGAAT